MVSRLNTLVFDIETVPDTELGRRLYDLGDLDDEAVAKVMHFKQLQARETDFLPHVQHRVIMISALLRTAEGLRIFSLGPDLAEREIVQRLIYPIINEAAICLDEGVVSSPGELDLALVYGIGFPPFHGGLLRWAETRGVGALVERMRDFETRFGPRFAPSTGLLRMAAAGSAFAHAEAKAEPVHAGTGSAT